MWVTNFRFERGKVRNYKVVLTESSPMWHATITLDDKLVEMTRAVKFGTVLRTARFWALNDHDHREAVADANRRLGAEVSGEHRS